MPIAAGLWSRETEVQRIESEQLPAGRPIAEQLVPGIGPPTTLAPNRQPFGVPVGAIESRLLKRDDVDQFVRQHFGPIHVMAGLGIVGRCHRHHVAGAGGHRADVRQADHAGAKPLMAVKPAGTIKDLDQRLARRRVAEPPAEFRQHLRDVPDGIAGQQLVVLAAVLDRKTARVERLHRIEHVEHFQRVFHPHVKRIGRECPVQGPTSFALPAGTHVEQAEIGLRAESAAA